MSNRYVKENVKKKLYAESMERCMNPNCKEKLMFENGDILEKAHIEAFNESADNSFENLILLCPNCHKKYDKVKKIKKEDILEWRRIRREEIESLFRKKFSTFEELKKIVKPILEKNKFIYDNYYLKNNKAYWDKFEGEILVNNNKLKKIFSENLNLFQYNKNNKNYSNLEYIQKFIVHIDEFEMSRGDDEKNREILFPPEINSMFGIKAVSDTIIPSVESLELLIKRLKEQKKFKDVVLGVKSPYIRIIDEGKEVNVKLDDTPRVRQLYYDYRCFIGQKVRLESLNFALMYIHNKNINFKFFNNENLREINIKGNKMIFVYEYCLSQSVLINLAPDEYSIIVNLHNWNAESCISKQAYELAENMNVKLLTMDDFYRYINEIK